MIPETLHANIQQIVGETPYEESFDICHHRISNVVSAEVISQVVEGHGILVYLANFFFVSAILLPALWMFHTLDLLDLVTISI